VNVLGKSPFMILEKPGKHMCRMFNIVIDCPEKDPTRDDVVQGILSYMLNRNIQVDRISEICKTEFNGTYVYSCCIELAHNLPVEVNFKNCHSIYNYFDGCKLQQDSKKEKDGKDLYSIKQPNGYSNYIDGLTYNVLNTLYCSNK